MGKIRRLVYCATPSRLREKTHQIMMFVIEKGYAPLHPFLALPYKYYDEGFFEKRETMAYCLKLVESCDELWYFGLSDGVETELRYAVVNNKKIRRFDFRDDGEIEQVGIIDGSDDS